MYDTWGTTNYHSFTLFNSQSSNKSRMDKRKPVTRLQTILYYEINILYNLKQKQSLIGLQYKI